MPFEICIASKVYFPACRLGKCHSTLRSIDTSDLRWLRSCQRDRPNLRMLKCYLLENQQLDWLKVDFHSEFRRLFPVQATSKRCALRSNMLWTWQRALCSFYLLQIGNVPFHEGFCWPSDVQVFFTEPLVTAVYSSMHPAKTVVPSFCRLDRPLVRLKLFSSSKPFLGSYLKASMIRIGGSGTEHQLRVLGLADVVSTVDNSLATGQRYKR